MNMREKLARAMFEDEQECREGRMPSWERQPEHVQRLFRSRVASVLTVLAEPDEGMCAAGADELFGSVEEYWSLDARRIFTAMITSIKDQSA